jgi:hypothetical protein
MNNRKRQGEEPTAAEQEQLSPSSDITCPLKS